MPAEYEVHPDDVVLTCPDWAEWLDDRHVSVKCKGTPEHSCGIVYCRRRWMTILGKGRWLEGIPKVCSGCAKNRKEAARKALPIDQDLIKAVREHAEQHYSAGGGWDYIVESYTDKELWELIAGSKTETQAIRKAGVWAGRLAERQAEYSSW